MNKASSRKPSPGLFAIVGAACGFAAAWMILSGPVAPSHVPLAQAQLAADDLQRLEAALTRAAARAARESAQTLATQGAMPRGCPQPFAPDESALEPTGTTAPLMPDGAEAEAPDEQAVADAVRHSERVITQALARGTYTAEDSAVLRDAMRVLPAEQQHARFAQLMEAVTQGRLAVEARGPLF